MVMAVDPLVRAGALNVPGGPILDIARQSPGFRELVAADLKFRTPGLLNGGRDGLHRVRAAVPRPAGDRAAARRGGDPGRVRVGELARPLGQPGGVRPAAAAHAAGGRRRQAGPVPVRVRRPDGAEPGQRDADARRRPAGRHHLLPQRPHADGGHEPARLPARPDADGARAGPAAGARRSSTAAARASPTPTARRRCSRSRSPTRRASSGSTSRPPRRRASRRPRRPPAAIAGVVRGRRGRPGVRRARGLQPGARAPARAQAALRVRPPRVRPRDGRRLPGRGGAARAAQEPARGALHPAPRLVHLERPRPRRARRPPVRAPARAGRAAACSTSAGSRCAGAAAASGVGRAVLPAHQLRPA